ncbi:MAG: TRAP transporter permease [Deltaproteobacteria bacterium]|nr:TRAP transporter permease [Deltaproteobacteria bacterium]
MKDTQKDKSSNGLKTARHIAEEEEGTIRKPKGATKYLIPTIAIIWTLFQLSIASWLILDTIFIRAIHLGFAIVIVYLNYPFLKKTPRNLKFLAARDRIPILDYMIAIIAGLSAIYIFLDYGGITFRYGAPIARDIVVGLILTVLLLEATRRVIGPALPVIAIVFCIYAFFGPYMPDLIAFKGVSMSRFVGQMTMSSEGIYGIPLDVSATIVFLFVLFGAMLDKAGAGRFFTNLALSFLGRFKGGAAKAAVVASGATGMVSGSSIANIVTTGPFTIPLMKKIGYPAKKAAAVEVASSTDGQLMPPIMGAAAFIIAEYVNVPYIEVVKAAAIPAFASYFGLFCITHLEASKLGIEGLPPEDIPSFTGTLKTGLHYLIPLVALLYELMYLRHSPELAAFRAIMLLIPIIFYQEIRKAIQNKEGIKAGIIIAGRMIVTGLVQGSKNMMSVSLACASAGIIVGVVALGIGGMISAVVESLAGGNLFLLLIITAMASLIIGMGLPTTATYIVMASLTAPIVVQVGGAYGYFIPLMAAHLFCFYFGILADDTPPVGLAAYAAAAIAESEAIPTGIQGFLYDIRTSVLAFLFVFNPELILYNINSWPQALLIFVMALIAMSSFECFAQGWCLTKNKWYDIPFFLTAALILFHPGAIASFFHIDPAMKYYFFPLGLLIYGGVVGLQKMRLRTAKYASQRS